MARFDEALGGTAEPVEAIRAADRIMVVGSPGCGKTWFARRLAQALGLPLVHLDDVYWGSGWARPSPSAWECRLEEVVSAPKWILDGNYSGSLRVRARNADVAIHLDPGPLQCLIGLTRRTVGLMSGSKDEYLPKAIKPGGSVGPGLPHLMYLALRYRARERRLLESEAAAAQLPIVTCSSRHEARNLLHALSTLDRHA